ncbi:transforming growth factor beta receptor binding [Homalodisca vitripennis]|nr:transforming growth factor beta receptor binding [Homalodisca vitripennis]
MDIEPQATNPSNHAAVQSFVHSLGLFPQVPAPSCVPHKMSAITVLYMDSDSSIVLKSYPGMVVKSCACR